MNRIPWKLKFLKNQKKILLIGIKIVKNLIKNIKIKKKIKIIWRIKKKLIDNSINKVKAIINEKLNNGG